MKRFLSLTLVTVMALSAIILTACQTQTVTPAPSETETTQTSEKTATPESTTTSEKTTAQPDQTTPTPEKTVVDIAAVENLLSTAVSNTLGLTSVSSYIEEIYKEKFDDDYWYESKSAADFVIEDLNDPNSQYSATGYQEDDGEKTSMYVAYFDQYIYMDIGGEMKMKMTVEEAEDFEATDVFAISEEYLNSMKYIFVSLPESVLKEADIKQENGNTVISVTLTDAQFKELFKEYTDAAIENVTYGEEAERAEFSDITISITINSQQYIDEYSINCTLDVTYTYFGETFNSTATDSKKIVVKNHGESFKVSAPENQDEFLTIKEFYIELFRSMDWKEFGADQLDLNVETWEEFITANGIDDESFAEVMEILTWQEFKEILVEDL